MKILMKLEKNYQKKSAKRKLMKINLNQRWNKKVRLNNMWKNSRKS